jgi:hypothetical protein
MGFCNYQQRRHRCFPTFQADDITKVHIVSHTYMLQNLLRHVTTFLQTWGPGWLNELGRWI